VKKKKFKIDEDEKEIQIQKSAGLLKYWFYLLMMTYLVLYYQIYRLERYFVQIEGEEDNFFNKSLVVTDIKTIVISGLAFVLSKIYVKISQAISKPYLLM
jgi:hypothetical protein